MANSIIYNQHFYMAGDKIVYQGEDTLPYASDEIILIADGLGGRGGFPHRSVDERILDRNKFFEIVFEPVFEKEVDEKLKNHILNSFNEIFETKDYFFLNNHTARSSGYFGSRLVSAIVLYEINYNKDLCRKKLFKNINSAKEAGQPYQSIIDNYTKTLAGLIKEKLQKIAANINLQIETKSGGAYLLPTTLALALVNDPMDVLECDDKKENTELLDVLDEVKEELVEEEKPAEEVKEDPKEEKEESVEETPAEEVKKEETKEKEEIEVVYIWAGDSRGYMWNEDGLAVLTDDHEKDETMTNLITLSKDFYLEGKMYTFKKPCILFNATDGCYKCPAFASPFDLEYIFLDAFKEVYSLDDGIKKLKETFEVLSSHDDSNTIALSTYGDFDSFESFKKAVLERLGYIDKEYITKLPGILTRDYRGELLRLEDEIKIKEANAKKRIIRDNKIIYELKKRVASYEPLLREKSELEDRISAILEQSDRELNEFIKLITANWLDGPRLRNVAIRKKTGPFMGTDKCRVVDDLRLKVEKCKEDYENLVSQDIKEIRDVSNNMISSLEEIQFFNEDKKFVLSKLSDVNGAFNKKLFANKEKYIDLFKKYFTAKERLEEQINKILEDDKKDISLFAEQLIKEDIPFAKSSFGDIQEEVASYIQNERAYKRNIMDLENNIRNLDDKYYEKYYEVNYQELYNDFLNRGLIKEEIIEDSKLSKDKQMQYEELKKCLEIRDKIYQDYQKNYERFW